MAESDQSFYALNPEAILSAVESLGFRCTGRALALNSMENRVYEVEIELKTEAKTRYDNFRVVKFYRPGRWSREQILEEHQFLRDLASNDIDVATPIANDSGETLFQLAHSGIYFSIYLKRGGRHLDELDDSKLAQLGRLIARMHSVGASREAKARIKLGTQTYGYDALEVIFKSNALKPDFKPRYESMAKSLLQMVEPWFVDVPKQRIHADFHLGNVLWDGDQVILMDFDDMAQGPCVQDLWLIVPGRDEQELRRRELLISGYEQMRNFDRSTLNLIEPLRALRLIHFSAWIAKRWDDPAFKRTFVEFGSERYWSEQIVELQEILYAIQGAN